jgi:hypothetical protein
MASGTTGLKSPLRAPGGCAPCPDSAVAWWAGEGDASDSLHAHNGTIINTVNYGEGKVGQAFDFGGVGPNGSVSIPYDSRLISSSWSLEAWVKPLGNGEVFLVGQISGRQLKLYPGTLGPKVALAVSTSPIHWQVLAGPELPLGVWSHVVGVFDAERGTLKLYVNGTAGPTLNLTFTPWDSRYEWNIGGINTEGYSGQYFSGSLDEVTVYNAALSGDQIQAIHHAKARGKCTPEVNATRDLLLVYNTSSAQSGEIKDYYLAHRPMVGGANVCPITCSAQYTITPSEFESNIKNPLLDWLQEHPTVHPKYIVLFLDVPSRISDNPGSWAYSAYSSVSYRIHTEVPGAPYVTHINMRDNDFSLNSTTSACRAYIDKLASIGTRWSPGSLIIRPSASGYSPSSQYCFDDTRFGEESPDPGAANQARLGVVTANPAASVAYVNTIDTGYQGANNQETGNGFWVGMSILVANDNQVKVTQLGRMMAPGNRGMHTVKLVDGIDGSVVAQVDISMDGGEVGKFQYGILSSPVILKREPYLSRGYVLLSHETPGGDSDFWYDWDTRVITTGVVSENGVAWGTGVPHWNVVVQPNHAFGPVDFKYNPTANPSVNPSAIVPAESAYVNEVVLGTPRNDFGTLGDHITSGSDVAGYLCWGAHSSLENQYAIDGKVHWAGNSGWWIIGTRESFNGQPGAGQGDFYMWFDHRAFRARNPDSTYVGGDYENTPVGAITNTDEPGGLGVNEPFVYFQSWEEGNNFAVCAWNACNTVHFQAVGDPFICK